MQRKREFRGRRARFGLAAVIAALFVGTVAHGQTTSMPMSSTRRPAAHPTTTCPTCPLAGDVFRVSELSLGYVYDLPVLEHVAFGIGAEGTIDLIPRAIEPAYGSDPISFMAFVRLKMI